MKDDGYNNIRTTYRSRKAPLICIAGILFSIYLLANYDPPELNAILGIIILSASSFNLLSIGIARLLYRLNPYCGVCGMDSADCRIRRRSLSPHRPGQT